MAMLDVEFGDFWFQWNPETVAMVMDCLMLEDDHGTSQPLEAQVSGISKTGCRNATIVLWTRCFQLRNLRHKELSLSPQMQGTGPIALSCSSQCSLAPV